MIGWSVMPFGFTVNFLFLGSVKRFKYCYVAVQVEWDFRSSTLRLTFTLREVRIYGHFDTFFFSFFCVHLYLGN